MKTWIVTGGGSGLGRELALLLSKSGYHVFLTGRDAEKLSLVQKEIKAQGGHADFFSLDITDSHEVKSVISNICSDFHVYGLVNNAGVGHFGPFEKIIEEHIKEMIATNVLGTIYTTKALLPYLSEKNEGHILNIISTAGLRGKVNEAVYVASKFAVRGFTESLQKEYENSGIRFTSTYMGGMDTPFWDNSEHIADPARLRSPREIAEIIINSLDRAEIIIENQKS